MADEVKNCFLINAPAGSGKTTQIKSMVRKFMQENPRDNILCITYSNRAAEELARDFDSEHIFIGTIILSCIVLCSVISHIPISSAYILNDMGNPSNSG